MIVCDIETGPLPEDVILSVLPPFDPEDVKLGNLKDPVKVAAKIDEARENHAAKFIEKAALSSLTGEVLVIGYLSTDTDACCLSHYDDERETLTSFWSQLTKIRKSKRTVVGHNFKGFDLPFLIGRSWILGVDVPPWTIDRGRFVNGDFIVDTMERWQVVTGQPFIKLGRLAEIFGVGEKTGDEEVNGAVFHKFWKGGSEKRDLAKAYLVKDLQLTEAIASRMNVI